MRFGDLQEDSIEIGSSSKFENKNILEWLDKTLIELDKEEKIKFVFSEIPENVRKSFYDIFIRDFSSRFERIISTTYASTMNELKRFGSEKEGINFEFITPELSYLLKFYKGNLLLERFASDEIEKIVVSIEKKKKEQGYKVYTQKNKIFIKFNFEKKIDKKIILGSIIEFLFEKWREFTFHTLNYDVNYLPAARSGILQGHKVLAASFVNMASMAGIKRMDIPALSGVVSDFIIQLIQFDSRRHGDFGDIAAYIEKEMIKGTVRVDTDKHSYPEIYYIVSDSKIPLHKTSSMVSETAPLVIYLRHIIQKNSYLIIEEPEAHLHPDVQRIFARVIARLVRKGLKVIITTHSDILLQQLNNQILMSSIKEENELIKRGYSKDDILFPSEVSAYLFKFPKNGGGAISEKIQVKNEGISDEEFAFILDELYNETAILHQKLE